MHLRLFSLVASVVCTLKLGRVLPESMGLKVIVAIRAHCINRSPAGRREPMHRQPPPSPSPEKEDVSHDRV